MPTATKTESEVTADCVSWLQKRGWIAERNNVGVFYTRDGRPMAIGKPGQPDWRFKHPKLGYMEIEFKRPGGKPDQRQAEYIAKHTHLGFLVACVDSLDRLQEWYFGLSLPEEWSDD